MLEHAHSIATIEAFARITFPAVSALWRSTGAWFECAAEHLECTRCRHQVPVRDGIPRFVETLEHELARRTQASFGYEWMHFDDWKPSGTINFQDYFHGIELDALRDARVLDGGCGMGGTPASWPGIAE